MQVNKHYNDLANASWDTQKLLKTMCSCISFTDEH
jgi:hypothetical protein